MKEFLIGGDVVCVDVDATIEFYKSQNDVLLDCDCEACHFYCDVVSKMDFEFFDILKKMGVTLTKNLETEPTGVWCVVTDEKEFLFCSNAFRVIAKIDDQNAGKVVYLQEENGFKVDALFYRQTENIVDVYIDINKLPVQVDN